jgi:glycosyltransferase involved in cell wall biosynthesis
MKICFLAGANSIHSYKWVKYFAENGHEVSWISLFPNDQGDIKGINFYFVKGNFIQKAFRIKKIIKDVNPDILHAHYAGINGLLAALSGFHPFVLTAWGSDILVAGRSKIKKFFIRYALHKADLITCDAEHMKKEMVEIGADANKIQLVRFGTNVKKFIPGPKDENLKKELGIKNNLTIISLRNFEQIYDIETLIKTIPSVLEEFSGINILIAGRGPEEKKLKNLVKRLNIENNVKFIGFIPNEDLPKYLKLADIYVSTSLSDAGISASTSEAMACGLPVIITDIGENKNWVKNGNGGYLVPIKNPKVFSEKIKNLLKRKDLREKFGKTNRKTIEKKEDYCKEMAKMEKIYYEIIKNH